LNKERKYLSDKHQIEKVKYEILNIKNVATLSDHSFLIFYI